MATLTVRNLPDDVHDALRRRAAEHRRSVEAEVRDLLSQAVGDPTREERKAKALVALRGLEPVVRRNEPAGWSGVDEFLAEKHLEAAFEAEQISAEERRAWLGKLERFEAWPAEIESFLDARIRRG